MANTEQLLEETVKLQRLVSDFFEGSGTAEFESSEQFDQQIVKCLAQLDNYKTKLNTLHRKVLEAILNDEDNPTSKNRSRYEGFSNVIERIRLKLNECRRGLSVLSTPTTQNATTQASDEERDTCQEQLQMTVARNPNGSSKVAAIRPNQFNSGLIEVCDRNLSNTEEILLNCIISLRDEYAAREVQYLAATMTRFAGDYIEFPFFLVEFSSLVHERTEFSDLQKHFILRNLLDGPAAKVIKNIPLCETSYQKALRRLMNYYGDCEIIVYCIFANVLGLPKIGKETDKEALCELLARVDRSLLILDLINCDKDYFYASMYPQLLRTIPDEMSIRFLTEQKSRASRVFLDEFKNVPLRIEATEMPKLCSTRFMDLRNFIEEAVLIREQYPQLLPKGRRQSIHRSGDASN